MGQEKDRVQKRQVTTQKGTRKVIPHLQGLRIPSLSSSCLPPAFAFSPLLLLTCFSSLSFCYHFAPSISVYHQVVFILFISDPIGKKCQEEDSRQAHAHPASRAALIPRPGS